jgi:hypothetical protein
VREIELPRLQAPERVVVITTDAKNGKILGEKEMGPTSSYVIVCGPSYYIAHEQVFPKSGTVQLTIRRHND